MVLRWFNSVLKWKIKNETKTQRNTFKIFSDFLGQILWKLGPKLPRTNSADASANPRQSSGARCCAEWRCCGRNLQVAKCFRFPRKHKRIPWSNEIRKISKNLIDHISKISFCKNYCDSGHGLTLISSFSLLLCPPGVCLSDRCALYSSHYHPHKMPLIGRSGPESSWSALFWQFSDNPDPIKLIWS